MKILMVSSESVPFSKTGGLADVVGALSAELNKLSNDARILIPSYNTPLEQSGDIVCSFKIHMLSQDQEVTITKKEVNDTVYYFVNHPFFNERKGVYGDTSFTPYSDNFERYTILCKSAFLLCKTIGFRPDIIHCHDWTTGLLPYYLKVENDKFFRDTKTVFTIHNLAYQGNFAHLDFLLADEDPNEKIFAGNQVNMLQAGLQFADFITTVSPTYAEEIQQPEQGCNLDSILVEKSDKLRGIINGIDINEWNPESDPLLEEHFNTVDLSGKAKLKEQIQKTFGLPINPEVPLFAMISRLASQKGFDTLTPVLDSILKENNIQFIIIGTGDSQLEQSLLEISNKNENLSVNIMFSNKYAHLVEAGSDFFLMPSRYEPCGLNQLYSLRYGTLPIARRTGGLADTILDVDENPGEGTGFLFDELTSENIVNSIERAIELYNSDEMKKVIYRAMNQDYSWNNSALEYIKIYKKLENISKE